MAKRIRLSNESLNCYGTWIKTDGMDLEQFEKNPVLLWMHQRGMVIGCIKDIKTENSEITGEPYFDEVREESKLAKQQYDKGTLKMASVNVDIIEMSDDETLLKKGQTRPTITKCKLVEVSMVDIGGNDYAITLNYAGKELKLSAGEPCSELPLLKEKEHLETKNPKNMELNYKAIALKLGLPETATEEEILARISLILEYRTANEKLHKEMDAMKLVGITDMVDEAVKAGKFGADKKEHFIKMGKTMGAEELKLTLDMMKTSSRPMDIVNQGSGAPASGSWKKLSEVPADQLELLRENNKDSYKRLYKAEYGIECNI